VGGEGPAGASMECQVCRGEVGVKGAQHVPLNGRRAEWYMVVAKVRRRLGRRASFMTCLLLSADCAMVMDGPLEGGVMSSCRRANHNRVVGHLRKLISGGRCSWHSCFLHLTHLHPPQQQG
jgi:hypothetical protein